MEEESQEKEKSFDTVSIVLLILIALTSDIADLVTDLIAAVPVVGQIVYLGNSLLISPITWIIIQVWFIMKVGLSGRKGLITGVSNLLGGLGNIANIPGSETIMTAIAIIAANHEEVTGALAGATGGSATALVGGPRARMAVAGAADQGATGIAATRAGAGTAASGVRASVAGEGTLAQDTTEAGAGAAQPAISEEEFGVQKEPLERLKEVMENIPEPEREKEGNI